MSTSSFTLKVRADPSFKLSQKTIIAVPTAASYDELRNIVAALLPAGSMFQIFVKGVVLTADSMGLLDGATQITVQPLKATTTDKATIDKAACDRATKDPTEPDATQPPTATRLRATAPPPEESDDVSSQPPTNTKRTTTTQRDGNGTVASSSTSTLQKDLKHGDVVKAYGAAAADQLDDVLWQQAQGTASSETGLARPSDYDNAHKPSAVSDCDDNVRGPPTGLKPVLGYAPHDYHVDAAAKHVDAPVAANTATPPTKHVDAVPVVKPVAAVELAAKPTVDAAPAVIKLSLQSNEAVASSEPPGVPPPATKQAPIFAVPSKSATKPSNEANAVPAAKQPARVAPKKETPPGRPDVAALPYTEDPTKKKTEEADATSQPTPAEAVEEAVKQTATSVVAALRAEEQKIDEQVAAAVKDPPSQTYIQISIDADMLQYFTDPNTVTIKQIVDFIREQRPAFANATIKLEVGGQTLTEGNIRGLVFNRTIITVPTTPVGG